MTRGCDVDGCNGPHYARGQCQRHYMRERYARQREQQRDTAARHERHITHLRRLVGLPDDGPTPEQNNRWNRQEKHT